MASGTSRKAAATKRILTPSMTLEGHEKLIQSISYFPDGQRMISGSHDKTTRQWDMKAGKEIEEARNVCKVEVWAVAVSRDGRWVVTGGRDSSGDHAELKACKVETGIVRTFKGSWKITCIDISVDNTLLASGADDYTARIWNLGTGKLVAGPFKGIEWPGAVRFSTDSKKLAVKSWLGTCLEVWDVQSQTLDVRRGVPGTGPLANTPLFWTKNNKNIIAPFSFPVHPDKISTIYEFDASTLETVGTPFEGHTQNITGLALSSDGALLASASRDYSIKLWAMESRQLLASFDVQNPITLVLSPDSCKLVYTTQMKDNYKIYICNTPPAVLAQTSARKKSVRRDLLNSSATRPPTGRRRPAISAIPMPLRPPPTINPKERVFPSLSKLLHFAPRTNALHSVQNDQHPSRDPLDVPATLPLQSPLSGQAATQIDRFEISSLPPPSNGVTQFIRQHLSFLVPKHNHAPVVEVAPGRKFTRLAAAKLPEYKKVDDTRYPSGQQAAVPQQNDSSDVDSLPDVHWCTAFLCYYSCLSHGGLRMPPRWRLERVDIARQNGATNSSHSGAPGVQHEEIELKSMTHQSQPEAGPSHLAVATNI
ncbi:uncharacterized protein BJ212DRAFT_756760 [Suillus subaureus]|uniref:Anaphase-promoting complex subunit 4 WD40 domain-containing protein n=1 Tax=Suillus subaureus TaxID=48587 RepID=A0A9P7DZZ1_9AGAM|nr:uncharacterized protein BJ212DRAFT_756760 [Suillus subaureus]KAG1807285.1 hypothetical protein BJ212DRAFT_756760 [Suillus subaureus]